MGGDTTQIESPNNNRSSQAIVNNGANFFFEVAFDFLVFLSLGNDDIFFKGDTELRTFEDMGEGGVKNQGKSGDFLYGRPKIALNTLVIKGAIIHKQMIPH